MVQVQTIVRIDADPTKPVQEICATINALVAYHPVEEERILLDIQDAINKRLLELGKPRDRPETEELKNEER